MKALVVDIECTIGGKASGDPFSPLTRLLCVGAFDGETYEYFRIEQGSAPYGETLAALLAKLEAADVIVAFNAMFDVSWIQRYVPGWRPRRVFDCQLWEYMDRSQTQIMPSLADTAERHQLPAKSEALGRWLEQGLDLDSVPEEELRAYNETDCRLTWALYQKQAMQAKPWRRLFDLHCADQAPLIAMQRNGVPFDRAQAGELAKQMLAREEEIAAKLAEYAAINWNSPEQVSAYLYGGPINERFREETTRILRDGTVKRGARWAERQVMLPGVLKAPENGARNVDKAALATVKHPCVELLEQLREARKLRTTYAEGLAELADERGWGDVLHGRYSQCTTRTGRLSSSAPNMQNFSGAVLQLFPAPAGMVRVGLDAKQLEWVCEAHLSRDGVAIAEIEAGEDVHANNMAAFNLPHRTVAKRFLFRLIYGGTKFSHDPQFSGVSRSDKFWYGVIDRFYKKYVGIGTWHNELMEEAVRTGHVTTPGTGRTFRFSGEPARPQVINYPVQALGADLMAIMRVLLWAAFPDGKYGCKWIATVHDSLLIDIAPEYVAQLTGAINDVFDTVPRVFERVFGQKFLLPLRCEIKAGPTWADMSPIEVTQGAIAA